MAFFSYPPPDPSQYGDPANPSTWYRPNNGPEYFDPNQQKYVPVPGYMPPPGVAPIGFTPPIGVTSSYGALATTQWVQQATQKLEAVGAYDPVTNQINITVAVEKNIAPQTLLGLGVTQEQIDEDRKDKEKAKRAKGAQVSFEAEKIGTADGQYIAKADWEKLSKEEQAILKTKGYKAYQEYIDDQNKTAAASNAEAKKRQDALDLLDSTPNVKQPDGTYDLVTAVARGIPDSTLKLLFKDEDIAAAHEGLKTQMAAPTVAKVDSVIIDVLK